MYLISWKTAQQTNKKRIDLIKSLSYAPEGLLCKTTRIYNYDSSKTVVMMSPKRALFKLFRLLPVLCIWSYATNHSWNMPPRGMDGTFSCFKWNSLFSHNIDLQQQQKWCNFAVEQLIQNIYPLAQPVRFSNVYVGIFFFYYNYTRCGCQRNSIDFCSREGLDMTQKKNKIKYNGIYAFQKIASECCINVIIRMYIRLYAKTWHWIQQIYYYRNSPPKETSTWAV